MRAMRSVLRGIHWGGVALVEDQLITLDVLVAAERKTPVAQN
jgi:hypothetical protein